MIRILGYIDFFVVTIQTFTLARMQNIHNIFFLSLSSILIFSYLVKGDDSSTIQSAGASYFLIVLLVMNSALFAGLTLGLMSLDKIGLEIIMEEGNEDVAKYARSIYPIREDGNFLLCTLLFGTVATNSLLSIISADLFSGLYGFISSTLVIVFFGEIIPQSVLQRPEYGLLVGYYTLPILRLYMILFYVFAKPTSMILNYTLGEEIGTIYNKKGLRKMLEIHVKQGALDVESGNILEGALKYKDMQVKEIMTPAKDVYMLNVEDRLNFKTLSDIFKHGFSRIPVFEQSRNNIVGMLLAKDLLFVDPEDEITISNFTNLFGRPLHLVWPDQKLGDVLKAFKRGVSHMAVVRDVNNSGKEDPFYEVLGIVTLEDIIEEILGEEINDEFDVENADESVLGETITISNGMGRNLTAINIDSARLQLLNPGASEMRLSDDEIMAVAAHIRANVPQLRKLICGDETIEPPLEEVEKIVRKCPVLTLTRRGAAHKPTHEDTLYRRGKVAEACTLVITGKLEIRAGKEGFRSELGPFSVVGADALLSADGYIPDFTATIDSDSLRCLSLTRMACLNVKSELSTDPTSDGEGNHSSPENRSQHRKSRRPHRRNSERELKINLMKKVQASQSDPVVGQDIPPAYMTSSQSTSHVLIPVEDSEPGGSSCDRDRMRKKSKDVGNGHGKDEDSNNITVEYSPLHLPV